MLTGCKSEEEKAWEQFEKAEKWIDEGNYKEALQILKTIQNVIDVEDVKEKATMGLKYELVPEENLEQMMVEDLSVLGKDYYMVWNIIGSDEDSIEEYLEDTMYTAWYKEGRKKPVIMDSKQQRARNRSIKCLAKIKTIQI